LAEKTAERLADEHKVSPKTIRRDEKKYLAVEKLKETHPEQAAVKGEKRRQSSLPLVRVRLTLSS
jgi:hypothetical protein